MRPYGADLHFELWSVSAYVKSVVALQYLRKLTLTQMKLKRLVVVWGEPI